MSLVPKTIPLLERCIQDGILSGYRRAHKHTDDPGEDVITNEIEIAIMNEIYEAFDVTDNQPTE
jgi:hypothetical protein